jgi:D-arabinose 1-dehydrogenase-like Zn-dependent alcohol dehydrogenase
MKAAVLERRGADGVNWREFPDPVPAPGESVLRVAASSLNRVDLYMRDNGAGITHALPQVMGVEAAGEIVEAEPGSGLKPGMKAVLFSEAYCGRCRYCLAGDQPLCENLKIMGEHRHGGFAEYIAMPSRCFMPLPDDADLVAAGALMTGHLTAWRMLFGKTLQPGECPDRRSAGRGRLPATRQTGGRTDLSPRRATPRSNAPSKWVPAVVSTIKETGYRTRSCK